MIKDRPGRVFVGVDESLASVQALRRAAAEARKRHAELHVVHVRRPARSVSLIDSLGQPIPGSWLEPPRTDWLNARAAEIIAASLSETFGGAPEDLSVHRTILVGSPGAELAALGRRDDDLLVVGTGGGRRWRHPGRRSVSRYCATHSRCPTLIVPRTELARMMHHRFVPRDLWKEFDATPAGIPRHVG
jgi:nucleotide-binding universal stress UspA family protein